MYDALQKITADEFDPELKAKKMKLEEELSGADYERVNNYEYGDGCIHVMNTLYAVSIILNHFWNRPMMNMRTYHNWNSVRRELLCGLQSLHEQIVKGDVLKEKNDYQKNKLDELLREIDPEKLQL